MGSSSAPPQAQPIDYDALMRSASRAADAQVESQFRNMIRFYPDMERQQLASAQNIAGLLGETGGPLTQWRQTTTGRGKRQRTSWSREEIGTAAPNQYTTMGREALQGALGQRSLMDAQAQRLSGIGSFITDAAAQNYRDSGPTSIESRLYSDAESELGLGRSLSAEQIRESQQAARSAMAARGLGASAAGTAAEILNRDRYASAREADRRTFAASANDMMTRNVIARRDQAAQQANLGAGILGNSAQLAQGSANLGLAGAQAALAIDPIQRGISPGLQMGANIQSNMGQIIQPTYANANQMAGNVASFNQNLLASNYNSWANQQGARMAANASRQAGMMGMFGGIGQGLMSAGGAIGSAAMMAPAIAALSDKREKTEIKPLGKSGSVLGLKLYSYKYKGNDKKRIGMMAQDVQKVLPEAVTEVEYKGKKRLAIKPAIIGAALAEELAAQAA